MKVNGVKKRFFGMKSIAAVVLLLAAGGAYWYFSGGKTEIQYKTATVTRGDIRSAISATGSLSAVETVDVGTQISGTVTKIYIDYNSAVKEGQLIAEMDSATHEADVEQYRASLLSAQADLLNAQTVLEKAQKDYNRTKQLAAQDLVAEADVDSDKSALDVAKAQLAAAQAKIAQSKATLTKAELNLGYTKIYSPVDGIVVSKNVDEGQTVAASYQTPSIAEIARNFAEMQVEVDVDEADIGGVTDGQKATFTVDAYPARTFEGEVTQIRLSPTTTDNVVTYTVIVKVANDDKTLLPGMTANVSLIIQDRINVLTVPNSAFRFKPVETNGNGTMTGGGPGGPGGGSSQTIAAVTAPAVYTLDDKKQPVKVEVERGISDGQNTEVLSGIEEGKQVITGIVVESD